MKLLFIKKRFSPYGGAERYLQTLLERLIKEGHEIHIISCEWTDTPGVEFHRVKVLGPGSFLSSTSFDRNVRKALRGSINPDRTISFERTTCQDVYRAGDGCHAEWLRLRRLFEPAWKRLSFRFNPLHRALLALEKKIFRDTEIIVTNSEMVKGQITRYYGRPSWKILTIYNGVDLEKFSPLKVSSARSRIREEFSLAQEAKVLLFAGSGFERKGLATLLRALSVMRSERSPLLESLSLLVVGKGNISKFSSAALRLGIGDKVIFLGARKDIERCYAAADVFVLPTVYDPFSNATLEAMACGLPVITSEGNGAAEILEDGVDGFILRDPFDSKALAEKIELALEDARRMGQNARHKAERYPIEKAADEFMQVISSPQNCVYGKLS